MNHIKSLRREKKISQSELADRVGVSLQTVFRWENGLRSPRAEDLEKLAKTLGTSVGYLMGIDEADAPARPIAPNSAQTPHSEKAPAPPEPPPPSYAYWGGVVDQARNVAERGNPEELSMVASLLEAASGLLADAKRRTFDLEQDGRYGKPRNVGESKTA